MLIRGSVADRGPIIGRHKDLPAGENWRRQSEAERRDLCGGTPMELPGAASGNVCLVHNAAGLFVVGVLVARALVIAPGQPVSRGSLTLSGADASAGSCSWRGLRSGLG